jgi:hypothetical protein
VELPEVSVVPPLTVGSDPVEDPVVVEPALPPVLGVAVGGHGGAGVTGVTVVDGVLGQTVVVEPAPAEAPAA